MHYYKRHIGDYAKKAGHLSPLEHGVYNLIIDSYYDREQAPTIGEAMRWARARSEEEKAAVFVVLEEFFVLVGDRYRQNRIEEELADYHGKAETNRKIALNREASRRAAKSGSPSEHEQSTDGAPEKHEPCTSGQPNHKPLTINQEKESRARGTRLPDDWRPSPEDIAFCKTERTDLRPSEVATSFYDYWIAIPGAKGRKADWSATWRNWVRKESPGKEVAAGGEKDWI